MEVYAIREKPTPQDFDFSAIVKYSQGNFVHRQDRPWTDEIVSAFIEDNALPPRDENLRLLSKHKEM